MSDIAKIIESIKNKLTEKGRVVIAIDGPCASGKSTLARELHSKLGGNLFHVDDFFLRPCQRTAERLSEVGGNFDRERFLSEIIRPLKEEKNVRYRPYVCYKGGFGEEISSPAERVNIIEGSYSMHTGLGEYADLKIFVSISPEDQIERLRRRDPMLIDRFINEWIPKENAYFEAFDVKERCDLTIEMNS